MNIFTSLLKRLSSEKASGDYSGTWFPADGTSGGINQANLLEANKEWAFIAVNKIATSVASIRFKVMRYASSGDDQEVFDGPLVNFLEAPAPNFTGKDFIYLNTVYKELVGNAFWEKLNRGQVKPLIPTRVTPLVSGGVVTSFKYTDDGKQRTIPAKDMLHDRYIDPAKPWWGVGKLQKIARWVDTSSFVTEFLNRILTNGATFGGFIETEEETETRIKLIKLGLANDHTGVANAGKVGVLPKGAKYARGSATPAELEMGATDDRYRDKILAAFGVPKTLVGLTTEVNRASAEASEYIFAKYTIKPIADDFLEFLNANVAPTLDVSGRFYFAYEQFVPVNMELELKEREIALAKQPYKTVNEVRAGVGLPPLKGGDVITQPAAPAAANDDDPEDEDPKDDKPKKAVPMRARAVLKRERLIGGIVSKALEVATAHHDPDEESHKAFAGRVEAHEKFVADKVRAFNNEQERELTLSLNRITKAVKKADLFDMEREVTVMVDLIAPLLKGLMVEQAIEEFASQDFPGQLDQAQPRFATVVEAAARRLARSYNKTTANLLLSTLNEGIEKGEALADLSARVRAVYDFSDKYRADAVARTESFYIANEGSREAFIQSGVVKTMRWYTAGSDACQYCLPMNGKTIGVHEVFFPKGHELTGSQGGKITLDYRAIDVPPLHTSCRCFIRPEGIDLG